MSRRRRQSNPISLFSFQDIITSVTGILILLAILLAISVITQNNAPAVENTLVDVSSLIAAQSALQQEVTQMETRVAETQQRVNSWIGSSPEELERHKNSIEAAIQVMETDLKTSEAKVTASSAELKQQTLNPKLNADLAKAAQIKQQLEQAKQDLSQLESGNKIVYNFRDSSRAAWLVQISKGAILAGSRGASVAPSSFKSVKDFLQFANKLPESEKYFVLIVRPSGLSMYDAIKEKLDDMDADVGTDLIAEDQVVVDPVSGASFK